MWRASLASKERFAVKSGEIHTASSPSSPPPTISFRPRSTRILVSFWTKQHDRTNESRNPNRSGGLAYWFRPRETREHDVPRRNYDRPLYRPSPRSEEHTSELQSLMRISYAVFCLNTKNTNNT